MRNIIFIIAIFFWILNLIAKNKKKQQQAAERERIAGLNKRVKQRIETEPKAKTPNKRTPDEILALFQALQKPAPSVSATDYESAYASSDYAPEVKKIESPFVSSESGPVSHFRKNYGMTESLGTESAEEKDAYNKDIAIIPRLSLTSGGIKQYIIASEILGKPKALRRR